jgi:hypothetical protein
MDASCKAHIDPGSRLSFLATAVMSALRQTDEAVNNPFAHLMAIPQVGRFLFHNTTYMCHSLRSPCTPCTAPRGHHVVPMTGKRPVPGKHRVLSHQPFALEGPQSLVTSFSVSDASQYLISACHELPQCRRWWPDVVHLASPRPLLVMVGPHLLLHSAAVMPAHPHLPTTPHTHAPPAPQHNSVACLGLT